MHLGRSWCSRFRDRPPSKSHAPALEACHGVPHVFHTPVRLTGTGQWRSPGEGACRIRENNDQYLGYRSGHAPRDRGNARGISARMKNDCSEYPRATTSCALACCVAAKEGYSSGFSNACRPDAAFELRFSHKHFRVLYSTSVSIGAGRRGLWRKTEVEPKFSRAPTPLRKSRFECLTRFSGARRRR